MHCITRQIKSVTAKELREMFLLITAQLYVRDVLTNIDNLQTNIYHTFLMEKVI
jgi:hypothetical protein